MTETEISELNEELKSLAKHGTLCDSSVIAGIRSAISHPDLVFGEGVASWRSSPDLLDMAKVRAALPHLTFDHFHAIGSTNDHLMSLGANAINRVGIAECQMSGRGRRDRAWISPYARSLSISYGYESFRPLSELGGLSTVVGVVLCQLFRHLGITASLKWPNDVLVGREKLCGILVEINSTAELDVVIVGVGLNVTPSPKEIAEVSQPVTDLRSHGVRLSRTEIASSVVELIDLVCRRFQSEGLEGFIDDFNHLHLYHNDMCQVHLGDTVEKGRVLGITSDGALRLETHEGEKTFYGGEVSLRLSTS